MPVQCTLYIQRRDSIYGVEGNLSDPIAKVKLFSLLFYTLQSAVENFQAPVISLGLAENSSRINKTFQD
jgi:hypothetical protein